MLRLMKKNRHCPLCHLEVCCHTGCVNSTSDQGYWLNNVHSFKVHFVCQCNIPLTQKIPDPQLPIRYSMTTSVTLVRNLGVIMDLSLSFLSHVSHIISSSFYQLRRINCSIKVLPIDTAKSLVNSFVISSIDCCNSLLTGLPHYTLDSLQRVINPAARMLCGAGKYSECYQIRALAACGTVALCLMMYKAMHGLAPTYLFELCASSCVEGQIRSSAHGNLAVSGRDKVRQTCICHRRSGSMELVAMLCSQLCIRGQFQDRSEDISVHCQYLTVPCILFLCCCMYCMISCVQRPWICYHFRMP